MKIVIDIPKEIYTGEKTRGLLPTVIDAISNGIPLPEHHGRLIDADALKNKIMYKDDVAYETWDELYDSVLEEIDNAPTIIEGVRGMPHSLKSKIKSLCYKGEITEKERDRIIQALEQQPCDDCISREAVIEWLKDKDIIKMNYQEENARRELAELPSVTPQQTRWIPVSERLPEENIHVLCQFYMGGMAECYHAHDYWHIVGGFRIKIDDVLAWMPLPEGYKEEEE